MSVSIYASGSVSSAGLGREALFMALHSQKDLSSVNTFNNKEYPVFALPEKTKEFVSKITSKQKFFKNTDLTVKYAIAATSLMLDELKEPLNGRGLINIATSRGNAGIYEFWHKNFLQTGQTGILTSPLTTIGNISSEVSSFLGFTRSINIDTSQTCSSASQAILNAIAWLEAEMVDWAIVGGSEAPFTDFTFAQVDALGIYTPLTTEKYPCRPFYGTFNTFALGEGAAVFFLKKNIDKTKPLAEISAWGASFQHPPSKTGIPDDGGPLLLSMKETIRKSKINPELILAHAPGTKAGDKAEFNAVNNLFLNEKIPLFSPKFLLGHTYGASAGLNLEIALFLFQKKSKLNYPYPVYIENFQSINPKSIMLNAAGFGGNAVSFLLTQK